MADGRVLASRRVRLTLPAPRTAPLTSDLLIQRILQNDILPALGPFPMRQISAAQILALMNAADARGAATVALLLRQIVGAVFRYADTLDALAAGGNVVVGPFQRSGT